MSDEVRNLSDREILILVHSAVKDLKEAKSDHESRIRVVEKLSAVAAGGVAVIGIVVGWLKLHLNTQ